MRTLLSIAICGALFTRPAVAQDASVATARVVAAEALEDYDAGQYEAAERKLAIAYEVVQVPTIALYRARSLVELGRLVEASEVYLECTRLKVDEGQTERQVTAQGECGAERAKLLPRIPKVVVIVTGTSLPVRFDIDGDAVNGALLRAGYLVDPGGHWIRGTTGEEPVIVDFSVREGSEERVELNFGARVSLQPGLVPAPLPAAVSIDDTAPEAVPTFPEPQRRSTFPTHSVGWAMLGIGGTALVVGVASGVAAGNRKDEVDDPSGDPAFRRAQAFSAVGLIGGFALSAGGATLLILPPDAISAHHGPGLRTYAGAPSQQSGAHGWNQLYSGGRTHPSFQ